MSVKKIKRKDCHQPLASHGKPVSAKKILKKFKMIEDMLDDDEKESNDDDLNKPLLNYSPFEMSPPQTKYQDFGDSLQKKILSKNHD